MIKRTLSIVLAVFLMLSIVACSGPETSETNSSNSSFGSDSDYGILNNGEPIELSIDFGGLLPSVNETPTAENPTVFRSSQYIADEFTKMYPNVTIKWEYAKGSLGDWCLWMTTQLAADSAPDIAFLHGATYAEKGWYIDLDAWLAEPNIFVEGNDCWKDMFPDYLWSSYMTSDANGKIVAIPCLIYPGSATAYYYNKEIFAEVGVEPPEDWEEFIEISKKINDAGYIAVGPAMQNKTVCVDNWDIQFSLGPTYAAAIQSQWDYNGDSVMSPNELLRASYEGVFSASKNPAVLDIYQQVKRKYTEVLEKGAANTDYETLWSEGKVAMMEDGLWRLPVENSNTSRGFEFGLFPAPVANSQTSQYAADIEYTTGPYQPPVEVSFNVIKSTVERKGSEEAAIRFLQWITKPENLNQMVLEKHGEAIGAVKGTVIPPELEEWFQGKFPKLPNAQWVTGPTEESGNLMSRYLELWIGGYYSDEKFIEQYDKAFKQGIQNQIDGLGVDVSEWTKWK